MSARVKIGRLLDRLLDHAPRTHLGIGRWRAPAFTSMALGSYALACGLAVVAAPSLQLPRFAALAMVMSSALTFLVLAYATKIITGSEVYVQYHYTIGVTLAVLSLSTATTWPPLRMLDLTAMCLCTCFALARLGCLMVGCCHGRRATHGIRYSHEFVAEGLEPELVGARLVPVQLFESLGLWMLLAWQVSHHERAGLGFCIYMVGYALLRHGLEFVRGDIGRRHLLGLSQAQWTAAFVCGVMISVWLQGWAPTTPTLVCIAALVLTSTIVYAALFASGRLAHLRIQTPRHMIELERVLDSLASVTQGNPVEVISTCAGVSLSGFRALNGEQITWHIVASGHGRAMTSRDVHSLAQALARITDHRGPLDWELGPRGVAQLHFVDGASSEDPPERRSHGQCQPDPSNC